LIVSADASETNHAIFGILGVAPVLLLVLVIIIAVVVVQKKKAALKSFQLDILAR